VFLNIHPAIGFIHFCSEVLSPKSSWSAPID
jgi:hypothetical protein